MSRHPFIPATHAGLSVAFPSLLWGRNCFTLIPSLHGFTVTLGGRLTLGAAALHEVAPAVYVEVVTMAERFMHDEAASNDAEAIARRDWFAHS